MQRKFHRLMRGLWIVVAFCTPFADASANVFYEYVGQDFNGFFVCQPLPCTGSPTVTSTPSATNPYATTDSIFGTFTVPAPLGDSGTYAAGPGGVNFFGTTPFTYSFSDGLQTMTPANSHQGSLLSGQFVISTDANGNIAGWNISVGTNTAEGLTGTGNGSPGNIVTFFNSAIGVGAARDSGTVAASGGSATGNANGSPGKWTGPIYLPVSGGNGTPFIFDVPTVTIGAPVLIDPTPSTGYIFRTGAGDPNFASVELPNIGNSGPYDLSLCSGASFVFDTTLSSGVVFDFAPGGVSCFEVTGIDPALGLDPNNPMAFITDLTFVGSGEFTGSMTSIVANAEDVPEPTSLALFGTALAGLVAMRRRAARKGV